MKTQKRGQYNEINLISLSDTCRKQVFKLVNAAKDAAKVDEHGGWDFGIDFDNKGRGSALNWDLYAIGRDLHTRKMLIIIQIRQFIRRRKNGFGNVRKSYFLIGRNEDKMVFAHAVESRVIHSAISAGRDVVRACQNWIFQADYQKVIRQGDIALVPVSRTSGERIAGGDVLISKSHLLTATEFRANGVLYALNPSMKHTPGTHAPVSCTGWHKVIEGLRAAHWDFATPTID